MNSCQVGLLSVRCVCTAISCSCSRGRPPHLFAPENHKCGNNETMHTCTARPNLNYATHALDILTTAMGMVEVCEGAPVVWHAIPYHTIPYHTMPLVEQGDHHGINVCSRCTAFSCRVLFARRAGARCTHSCAKVYAVCNFIF